MLNYYFLCFTCPGDFQKSLIIHFGSWRRLQQWGNKPRIISVWMVLMQYIGYLKFSLLTELIFLLEYNVPNYKVLKSSSTIFSSSSVSELYWPVKIPSTHQPLAAEWWSFIKITIYSRTFMFSLFGITPWLFSGKIRVYNSHPSYRKLNGS